MKSLIPCLGSMDLGNFQLLVSCKGYNTVTASKDGTTKSPFGVKDIFGFTNLSVGNWTITCSNAQGLTKNTKVNITNINETVLVNIYYNTIPKFTYTGSYEIVNDNDEIITESQDNWKIRFLTSGTLKFTELQNAVDGIDVFLVGGGGAGGYHTSTGDGGAMGSGGGGGGYTSTAHNVSVSENIEYIITIGGGGTSSTSASNAGGQSAAFTKNANGGNAGFRESSGGNGGSGGGGGGYYNSSRGGNGGSDGSNGLKGSNSNNGGKGQGTTTREFGESTGKLYAGGGGGGSGSSTSAGLGGNGGGGRGQNSGTENTGGGGGGAHGKNLLVAGGKGGSGIVIIRNKR